MYYYFFRHWGCSSFTSCISWDISDCMFMFSSERFLYSRSEIKRRSKDSGFLSGSSRPSMHRLTNLDPKRTRNARWSTTLNQIQICLLAIGRTRKVAATTNCDRSVVPGGFDVDNRSVLPPHCMHKLVSLREASPVPMCTYIFLLGALRASVVWLQFILGMFLSKRSPVFQASLQNSLFSCHKLENVSSS